jgi:glycosyltransferase involved in cell wall biosynthesis
MSAPRVAIVHDGFVPVYRVPLYESLSRAGDIDYVVFHSEPPPEFRHLAARPPFAFEHRYVPQRDLHLAGRRLIFQRLVREVVADYDAVVLGAWLRFGSTHALRVAFEALGRPVVYWGHGGHVAEEDDGVPRGMIHMRELTKARLARSVDAYLAYTAGGAAKLVDRGVDARRVFALGNTIDMRRERHLRAQMQAIGERHIRLSLGLARDTPVVVFIGRFIAPKRVGDLVAVAEAVNGCRDRPAKFVLIGDGPELSRVQARAADAPHVKFTGALFGADVARWLACADAVAVPGAAGLVVNHAFAHGVPVVARVAGSNGPEAEYVEHGRNGLLVDGSLDDFAQAIASVLDSPERREALAAGARQTADALGLEPMVDAFDRGVRSALAKRGRLSRPARAPAAPRPRPAAARSRPDPRPARQPAAS